MSKERLEEIKDSYLRGIHRLFGTPWVSMPKENFDWLIEQAEKVEEYKEIIEMTGENYELEQETNKRYREVLKGILKILNSEDWTMYDAAALQDNIDDYLTLENGDLLEGEE